MNTFGIVFLALGAIAIGIIYLLPKKFWEDKSE